MRHAAQRVQALATSAALFLCRTLGPMRASDPGSVLGRTIDPCWLPVSAVAHANLRLTMPEHDAPSRRRIVRAMWDNLERTVAELPHLAALRRNTPSGPRLDRGGAEVLEARARKGNAVHVRHIGNWEVLPPTVAQFGLPFASSTRQPLTPDRCDDPEPAPGALGCEVPLFARVHMAPGRPPLHAR